MDGVLTWTTVSARGMVDTHDLDVNVSQCHMRQRVFEL